MSASEEELQRRIADVQARVVEPMRAEEARLRQEYPGQSDAWYSVTASQTVQRINQRRRVLWNPLSWF